MSLWYRYGSSLTGCDANAGHEVVDDGEEGGPQLQRGGVGGDAAVERHADDEDDIEPVDVLVPVLAGHGQVRDVRFLGVGFGRRGGGGGGGGRGEGGSRRHDGGEERESDGGEEETMLKMEMETKLEEEEE